MEIVLRQEAVVSSIWAPIICGMPWTHTKKTAQPTSCWYTQVFWSLGATCQLLYSSRGIRHWFLRSSNRSYRRILMDLEGPQFWNTRLVLAFVPWTKMNDANLSLPYTPCASEISMFQKNCHWQSAFAFFFNLHFMLTFHDIPIVIAMI